MNVDPTEHVTATEARGGVKRPMVRRVLVIGTALAVVALFLVALIA